MRLSALSLYLFRLWVLLLIPDINTLLDLVYGKRHFVDVVWLFLVATVSWWGGRLGAALVNKRVL